MLVNKCSRIFRIIVFTSADQSYADLVIDNIDKGGHVVERLYRNDLIWEGGHLYKDVGKRCGELSSCLIVDDKGKMIKQQENFLPILPFHGDLEQDTALMELCDFLEQNWASGDMRLVARKWKEKVADLES